MLARAVGKLHYPESMKSRAEGTSREDDLARARAILDQQWVAVKALGVQADVEDRRPPSGNMNDRAAGDYRTA
jgi:hypothetical protein